jgi:hypothetical protein
MWQQFKSVVLFAAFVAVVVGIVFTGFGFGFAAVIDRQIGGSRLLTAVCFGGFAAAVGFVASLLLMSRDVASARKRIRRVRERLNDFDDMSDDEFRLHFVGIRAGRLNRIRSAIAEFYDVDPDRLHPSLDLPDVLLDLRSPALPAIVARAALPDIGRIRLRPMELPINNLADFIVGVNRVIQQATA